MRQFDAYLNKEAAREVNSVFDTKRYVRKLYKDGLPLWELVEMEEADEEKLEAAQKTSEIEDIINVEKKEIVDIESFVNHTFRVIQEGILMIHTQLNQLKILLKEDEILEKSGFPIEIADQLEDMLKKEISCIVMHLRQMAKKMEDEENKKLDNSPAPDQDDFIN